MSARSLASRSLMPLSASGVVVQALVSVKNIVSEMT